MRTIESMCLEITNISTENISIYDIVSDYVNILSSDEIYFALEGIEIQILMDFINQTPMTEELCCSYHYSQILLKSFLLYSVFRNLENVETNVDDSSGC